MSGAGDPLPVEGPAVRRRGLLGAFAAAQRRERDAVLAETARVKGLMPLLMKHRDGHRWTREERQTLLAQMRAIAHLSPYLVVLVLPGSFVFLPVLAWWLDRRRERRHP